MSIVNKNKNSQPYFSIVIANYNYGSMIGAAIESIINQNEKDFEIIVIDGGSTDNSIEVIKRYEKHLSFWISEEDNGQSNAFNKGFQKSNGKFISWLNADDVLLPGTLQAVKNRLLNAPHADWATGNFIRFSMPDLVISEATWGPHFLPHFLQGPNRVIPVFGPTAFWKRSVYELIGGIDENLHYMMDVEYWSRLTMLGYKQIRVNHYCWGFRMHTNSKTAEFLEHKIQSDVKIKMDFESKYIKEKNGHNPLFFFRYLGYFLRIIDGSALKAVWNKFFLVGRSIKDVYGINKI